MPDMDPVGNPVGFWAFFFVLAIIVILLAAGPLAWVVSLWRQARDRVDPNEAARAKNFDKVEAEQRRLDEDLEKMRAELKVMREGNSRTPPEPPDAGDSSQ